MQQEIKEKLEKKTLDKQNLKTQFDNFFLEKPEPKPVKVVEQFSIEDELNSVPLKTKKNQLVDDGFTVVSDIKFKPERPVIIDEEI